MNPILWLWYYLTAYIPRRLPRNPDEYDRMKHALVDYFGLPNEPQVWALVAGQVTSRQAHKLRMPWGLIANAAKRIEINNVAQEDRKRALAENYKRLEAATQKHSALMQGVDKLLGEHPDLMASALAGDEDALDCLASEAESLFPEQGATPEQWRDFIKNQSIQKNVARANKENPHAQKSAEELKAADAEPGPSSAKSSQEVSPPPLQAEALGKRSGKAGRGPQGTA